MTEVPIATVIAALRQAAQEKGHTLSDTLAALMIGQLRGAEVAYPGVHSSLGGTNNYGAAQATKGLYTAKQGQAGWGALAHKDSDPNQGAYLGWYWIAPSPLEGARYWLSNWWGNALLGQNPSDATTYATILYKGRYFGGMHAGDPDHDPTSEAGQANIADYAKAVSRGIASAGELAAAPGDPAAFTVDPSMFQSLAKRQITEDLFDKAKAGKIGDAWSYLLPASYNDFVASNGVAWFGPPPAGATGSVESSGPLATITQPVISVLAKFNALPTWQKALIGTGAALAVVGLTYGVVVLVSDDS